MMVLSKWVARRAGGRITIKGEREGAPHKVVGVDQIQPHEGKIVALVQDGTMIELR